MRMFRGMKREVLIVTDLAARGLDVPLLDFVIHYNFSDTPNLFIHRSGRVARMGRPGNSYGLITTQELPYLIDVHL
jgi:ATP-dependent RNA helicase DDX54/DBP10